MRNLEARLTKLEAAQQHAESPNGGIFFVLMNDGESESQALRRTMREQGIGNPLPKLFVPIFGTELDWKL